MQKAEYWHKTPEGKAQCELCPHHCVVAEGKAGLCRVRGVRDGELQALCYGVVSSAAMDPIEKKPLYHFHPGSQIFSIGGWGCNLACVFCQNWTISQQVLDKTAELMPSRVVKEALGHRSVGVAYTYNEPIVGFEFVRDCARLAKDASLANVLVTNGFIEREPARELLPFIHALNIDIKSMDDQFYKEHCRGRLQPVLDFAKQSVDAGCHVEITNLVIPGLNDKPELFTKLAQWIRANLGQATPLHFSAYRPEHKLTVHATPPSTLEKAFALAKSELQYVYLGNVRLAEGSNTACPGCKAVLVSRRGYLTEIGDIKSGACGACGRKADMVL